MDLDVRKLFVFHSIRCIDDNKGNIGLAKKILSFFDKDEKKIVINELDEAEHSKSLILIFKDLKSYKIDEHSYFNSLFFETIIIFAK